MRRRKRSKTGLLPYSERERSMMRDIHASYLDFSLNRYARLNTWLASDEYQNWRVCESAKVQLMEGDWRQP